MSDNRQIYRLITYYQIKIFFNSQFYNLIGIGVLGFWGFGVLA